ncbi:hypothetical protein FQA47_008022 [Oryzias melastigma]|uniref:Uncharacterized protein n=1 Tax=Oryzias melastigma TaxID=30732 RepID=A0A834CSI4_ORYME|nr:hypothetical protein FQA47_008022 [Oryzias melastigma]
MIIAKLKDRPLQSELSLDCSNGGTHKVIDCKRCHSRAVGEWGRQQERGLCVRGKFHAAAAAAVDESRPRCGTVYLPAPAAAHASRRLLAAVRARTSLRSRCCRQVSGPPHGPPGVRKQCFDLISVPLKQFMFLPRTFKEGSPG